jgi:hypothetical protein
VQHENRNFNIFGYVISDDIQTRNKLNEISGKINDLTSQVVQSENKLKICSGQLTKDQQAIDQRDQKISILTASVNSLEGQITQLKIGEAVLKVRKSMNELLGSNPIVIAGLLIFQVISSAAKYKHKVGLRLPSSQQPSKNNLIRLSEEEMALIIQKRRGVLKS